MLHITRPNLSPAPVGRKDGMDSADGGSSEALNHGKL